MSNYNKEDKMDNSYYDTKKEFKRKQRRKKRMMHNIRVLLLYIVISATVILLSIKGIRALIDKYLPDSNISSQEATPVMEYNISDNSSDAKSNTDSFNISDYDTSDIPDQLLELMEKHPETRDFVLDYPELKDASFSLDVSNEITSGEIPLFIQWDKRWGYKHYGDDFFALTGCGPTCLSMVVCGLGGDTSYNPYAVGELMETNGYYEYGSGSLWSMMTDGASLIGLNGEEISLDKYVIYNHLSSRQPIICSMREGDFTETGHFIVLTDIDSDYNVTINDPNSRENSSHTWTLEYIMPQIKNLWSFSLK